MKKIIIVVSLFVSLNLFSAYRFGMIRGLQKTGAHLNVMETNAKNKAFLKTMMYYLHHKNLVSADIATSKYRNEQMIEDWTRAWVDRGVKMRLLAGKSEPFTVSEHIPALMLLRMLKVPLLAADKKMHSKLNTAIFGLQNSHSDKISYHTVLSTVNLDNSGLYHDSGLICKTRSPKVASLVQNLFDRQWEKNLVSTRDFLTKHKDVVDKAFNTNPIFKSFEKDDLDEFWAQLHTDDVAKVKDSKEMSSGEARELIMDLGDYMLRNYCHDLKSGPAGADNCQKHHDAKADVTWFFENKKS